MGWKRASFKGKQVWAEVDEAGEPVVSGGRLAIRYSPKEGATLYRAGASGVSLASGPVEQLPDGVAADDTRKTASKGGKSSKGSGFGSAGSRTAAQAAMAADAARALIAGLPEGTALAFTDGACMGNPGPAGAGAWVRLPDGRVAEVSRSLGHGTNNIGELTGVALALKVLDEAGLPADAPVALFSDSQYANGVLAKGWKAKVNQDLISDIRGRLARRPGVRLHWIAGHVGIPGNERADALANAGAAGRSEVRWIEG